MAFDVINSNIPTHMVDSLIRYIKHGIAGGSFMTAVMSNNLVEAFAKADDMNAAAMKDWAMALYNDVPLGAWGSPEIVRAWVESGGLVGRDNAQSNQQEKEQ